MSICKTKFGSTGTTVVVVVGTTVVVVVGATLVVVVVGATLVVVVGATLVVGASTTCEHSTLGADARQVPSAESAQ